MNYKLHCVIYTTFFSLNIGRETHAQSQYPVSSGLYERTYTDGPGGACMITTPVSCPQGWIRNGTIDSERRSLARRRKCKFYKKSAYALCFEGKHQLPTCTKSVISYYITPACSGYWLPWDQCDKTCGGGVSTRVKIIVDDVNGTNKFQIATEKRPCNTQPCPYWTQWTSGSKNSATLSCDVKTCTRKLERKCIYNGTVIEPSVCESPYSTSTSKSSERENNLTSLIIPCFKNECQESKTAVESTTFNYPLSENTLASTPNSSDTYGVYMPVTEGSKSFKSVLSSRSVEKNESVSCPVVNDNMLLGVAVGFVAASCIFAFGCFVLHRKLLRDKFESLYYDSLRKSESRGVVRSGSIITGRIDIFGSLHSVEQLQSSAADFESTGVNERSTTKNEAIYCTVPNQVSVSLLSNMDGINSWPENECIEDSSNAVTYPLYSHIPAYLPAIVNGSAIHESDVDMKYSSSEFSSNRDSEYDHEPDREISQNHGTEKNEASFDSDEGRDVLNTLRRPSKKFRRSKVTDENYANDVFLSEDEQSVKEDLENERKLAFSVRYTKIMGNKPKLQGHKSQDVKEATTTDFQWIEGNRRTPTQSESSSQSNDSHLNQKSNRSWVKSREHQKLSCRHSSGASSVASFNVDVTTSGYSSAITSPFEDRSIWSKHNSLENQTFSKISDQYSWLKMKNIKDGCCRDLYKDKDHEKATEMIAKTSNTLCNPKQLHSNGLENNKSGKGKCQYHAQNHIHGQHIHSLPYKSRNSCHVSRIIETEDIYSSPIDAKDIKDPIYFQYNVPFDALPR